MLLQIYLPKKYFFYVLCQFTLKIGNRIQTFNNFSIFIYSTYILHEAMYVKFITTCTLFSTYVPRE